MSCNRFSYIKFIRDGFAKIKMHLIRFNALQHGYTSIIVIQEKILAKPIDGKYEQNKV